MKAVIQYDLNTNERLTYFPSIRDAAHFINVSDAAINKAVKEVLNSVKGWGWRYATEEEKEKFAIKCIREYNSYRNIVNYYDIVGRGE